MYSKNDPFKSRSMFLKERFFFPSKSKLKERLESMESEYNNSLISPKYQEKKSKNENFKHLSSILKQARISKTPTLKDAKKVFEGYIQTEETPKRSNFFDEEKINFRRFSKRKKTVRIADKDN